MQNFGKITDPFRRICQIFLDLMSQHVRCQHVTLLKTENRKMSTCNFVGFRNTRILTHYNTPSLSVYFAVSVSFFIDP